MKPVKKLAKTQSKEVMQKVGLTFYRKYGNAKLAKLYQSKFNPSIFA